MYSHFIIFSQKNNKERGKEKGEQNPPFFLKKYGEKSPMGLHLAKKRMKST